MRVQQHIQLQPPLQEKERLQSKDFPRELPEDKAYNITYETIHHIDSRLKRHYNRDRCRAEAPRHFL